MPEKLAQKAKTAYKKKKYSEAAALFDEAAKLYKEKEDLLNEAEMLNNCSVALLLGGDAREALQAAQGTDQIFAEAADFKRQAMALGNQAAALDALGKLNEALEHYQDASELLKGRGEDDLRSYLLQQISTLQIRSGNQLQSLASMQAALDSRKKLSMKERMLKKLLKTPMDMLNKKDDPE